MANRNRLMWALALAAVLVALLVLFLSRLMGPSQPAATPTSATSPPAETTTTLPEPPVAATPAEPVSSEDTGGFHSEGQGGDSLPLAIPQTWWGVQIASFRMKKNATRAAKKASKAGLSIHRHFQDGLYKVWTGRYKTRAQAESYRDKLRQRGYPNAFIVQWEAP